jgi:mono/diheme cytochrome c family protein
MNRATGAVLILIALTSCVLQRERLREGIAPTREESLSEGRRAYERACASCHGLDARGGGTVAPTLKMRPSDLTQLAARNGGVFPRERVAAVIAGDVPVTAHGTAEMPVWRTRFGPASSGAAGAAALSTRRWLDAILDYLETLQVAAPTPRCSTGVGQVRRIPKTSHGQHQYTLAQFRLDRDEKLERYRAYRERFGL